MIFIEKAVIGFVVIIAAVFIQVSQDITKAADPPKLDSTAYWGPKLKNETNYKDNTAIKPFKISYNNDVIKQLKTRLEDFGVLPEPLEGTAFEYGFNSKELTKLVKYWKDSYLKNWQARETFLNKFPHFKTKIQG